MKHYLRPSDTMSHYLRPNSSSNSNNTLANEVIAPADNNRRMLERHHNNQRAATLVKDDDLWKELRQELARSKVISKAGVQEITRNFMLKRQKELDAQTKRDQQKELSRNRRSSNEADYSRRSSLSMITQKGQTIRRALSMGNGDEQRKLYQQKGTRRESVIGNFMNSSFSKMNDSVSKLSLEARPKMFHQSGTRSRSDGDVNDNLSEGILPDLAAHTTTNLNKNNNNNKSRLCLHFSSSTTIGLDTHQEGCADDELSNDGCGYDTNDDANDDDDDELLVLFPSRPRRRTQQNTTITDMARTA